MRIEFENRLQHLHEAGQTPDPKIAQVNRLKTKNGKLKEQLAQAEQTIEELTDFRTQALARLAAQHEEIVRLRQAAVSSRVRRIPPAPAEVIGICS